MHSRPASAPRLTLQRRRRTQGKRWVPLELDRALQQLDTEMDNLFNYSEQPAAEAKPKEPKDEDVDELRAMLASKVRRPQHSRAE
jgi:hypothetical protein